jgi:hypothetical protein
MKRLTLIAAVVIAALALLAAASVAQGWGCGAGRCWANVSPQDMQKVTDLRQKTCQAQWDLWGLQAQKADQKKIDQKTSEVARLRGELAKLVAGLPVGPGIQATPGGAVISQAVGLGRGPCGLGLGLGRGGGRGMGFGRGGGWGGAGMCWRWQQTQPQPPVQ